MKDALGHGSDSRGGGGVMFNVNPKTGPTPEQKQIAGREMFGSHADGVNRVGAYKLGSGPGTYKFNGSRVTIAEYQHGGGKITGVVGTMGQSVHELASIIKQHPGDDRHSQNVRMAARLELAHRPVRERMAAGVM